jgi:bacteriocin biosynthesis cyclodehydratase domain-containing protein
MDVSPTSRFRFCPDAPVTWREPGVVSFGEDPHIRVSDVTAAELTWLTGLTGMLTWAELEPYVRSPGQRRLFDAAIHTGTIEDLEDAGAAWRMLPTDQRTSLSADLAAYRHTYRSSARAHAAMDARLQMTINIMGSGPLRDMANSALDLWGISVVGHEPDITLIAAQRHPDALPIDLMHDHAVARTPHLPVHVYANKGVIGPLVIPGVTACTTCVHLRSRDRDPHHVLQAAQRVALTPSPWPMDRIHAMAVIAQAILILHTWRANPQAPHLWANQRKIIWLPDGSVETERLVPHPECGCFRSPLSVIAPHT